MAKMAWEDAKKQEEIPVEAPQPELWHYHVTCVCRSFTISPVVTSFRSTAVDAYNNMVLLVGYATGLEVNEKDQQKAIFSDGSTVRWYQCSKNCLFPG